VETHVQQEKHVLMVLVVQQGKQVAMVLVVQQDKHVAMVLVVMAFVAMMYAILHIVVIAIQYVQQDKHVVMVYVKIYKQMQQIVMNVGFLVHLANLVVLVHV